MLLTHIHIDSPSAYLPTQSSRAITATAYDVNGAAPSQPPSTVVALNRILEKKKKDGMRRTGRVWTHRTPSTLHCCRFWSPSTTSTRSYACLVIVAPICCHAHVVSDDRSHSSYVVDPPTMSAFFVYDELPVTAICALSLDPDTEYHAAPTPRSPSSRMDVLLVTHACTGSGWREQCDGDATRYGDDDVAYSPPAACGSPDSPLTWEHSVRGGWMEREAMREEVREEVMHRMDATTARALVVDSLGGAAGDGGWRHGAHACTTTRDSSRSGIACSGVAQACNVARDNERGGLREAAMRDHQRGRCTCTSRERCRAALGIRRCVPNVPWDIGGVSCLHACDTAHNNEHGVRATCGGGFAAHASVGCAVDGAGTWCPRDGAAERACGITRVVETDAYGGVLWSIADGPAVPASVGYALERRGDMVPSQQCARQRTRRTRGVWQRIVSADGVPVLVGCAVERRGKSGNVVPWDASEAGADAVEDGRLSRILHCLIGQGEGRQGG
ncbi:hypothetical protein B0H19DRAFT_1379936 [Mycena capillaripes]|nr:hypothetical protein B0H19DRAFT_1379936 [Mycena capillaripes]